MRDYQRTFGDLVRGHIRATNSTADYERLRLFVPHDFQPPRLLSWAGVPVFYVDRLLAPVLGVEGVAW